MLVLTRKPGERIKLTMGNTEVLVTVLSMDRNKVKIGIDAPEEVKILRTEIEGRPVKN